MLRCRQTEQGRWVFTSEFNVEAVRLVTEKVMKFPEAAEQLGIRGTVPRAWKKWDQVGADAFPGH